MRILLIVRYVPITAIATQIRHHFKRPMTIHSTAISYYSSCNSDSQLTTPLSNFITRLPYLYYEGYRIKLECSINKIAEIVHVA